jgi:RHS repeat-associated protein
LPLPIPLSGKTSGKEHCGFEYQYAIADHQGNTRVVFSSVTPAPESSEVGFQTASADFDRDDVLISHQDVMNHTPTGSESQLLTGGYNSQVGATRSFRVYPGDKVKAEVFAKYRNLSSNTSNLLQFATALTTAFGLSPGGSGEAYNEYQSMNSFGVIAADSDREEDDDASPKGFITILLFDKHRNFVDAAWDQIDDDYDQTGIVTNDPFDHLEKELTVTEEGYVYIFVSNENASQVDIHFDDLKVTHTKTNVIQYNEYYPFGLQASTSWTRENNKNDYLYNESSQLNTTSGWYDLPFRNYDAALGRFMQVDPLAALDNSTSPFAYGGNNPVVFNDPSGLLKATSGQLARFINRALSGNGGRWSDSDERPTYYGSDAEGFSAGVAYMDQYAMWGGGGRAFANSFEYASLSYGLLSSSPTSMMASLTTGPGNSISQLTSIIGDPFGTDMLAQQGAFLVTDPAKAYEYMWNNSFRDGKAWRENLGFLVEGGVIVLPTEGPRYQQLVKMKDSFYGTNNSQMSRSDYIPYTYRNGTRYVYLDGKEYKVLAGVHTHPEGGTASASIGYDTGDEGWMRKTKVSTLFIIGSDQVGRARIIDGALNQGIIGTQNALFIGGINLHSLILK